MASEKFEFEKCGLTYPTGFAKIVKRIRIEQVYPDRTVATYRIELLKAPEGKVFFKRSRFGSTVMDSDYEHKAPLTENWDSFYQVSQSFHNLNAKDGLGGYQWKDMEFTCW